MLFSLLAGLASARVMTRLPPSKWSRVGDADPNAVVDFRLALVQRNVAQFKARLEEIADPDHPDYGQWMTREAVSAMVNPAKADNARVERWVAEARGIKLVDNRGDMIVCRGRAADVAAFLDADLGEWVHRKNGVRKVRTLAVTVPDELDDVVEQVIGLFEFWTSQEGRLGRSVPAGQPSTVGNDVSAGYVIPDTVRNIYGIPTDAFRDVSAQSSVCVVEFQDYGSYAKSDLVMFDKGTGEIATHVDHIVGPFQGNNPQAESALDIEYMAALALNSSIWYWTEKIWVLEFANDFFAYKNGPLIVSMSWGWPEPWQCQIGSCSGITSQTYFQRAETEFAKITATGVTLFASSGDQGAPGDMNPSCSGSPAMSDIYPGGSSYITSVGATMLKPTSTPAPGAGTPSPAGGDYYFASDNDAAAAAGQPPICSKFKCATETDEVACSYPGALITTGGGFTTYNAQPSWQSAAVKAYLTSGVALPPSGTYNPAMRAFPDVSANGHAYLIALQGSFIQVDGTSCSSPAWAGIMALLNGRRLDQGKKPLGFINPALYKAPANVFTDIAVGNNKCTESCCGTGFNAGNSWDPVTGLGTPVFDNLLNWSDSLP